MKKGPLRVNQKKAYFFALIAVLLWSTVASAFKLTLQYLNFKELLLYSNLFSVIILGLVILGTGKFKQVLHCTKQQYLRSFLLGALNPFLYYLFVFQSYELLPAQEAQPLNYTWALTLAVLSVPLLKQKIHFRDFLGLIIAYCGVLVISTQGDVLSFRVSEPTGVTLALGSTILWALYWIYNTNDDRDPVVCLFLCFVSGLILITIYYGLSGDYRIPEIQGLLGAAYAGAFEMSITFMCWLYALRYSENTAKIGSLIFLSPFISIFLIHFFVGEEIKNSTIIGLLFIVSGLLVQKFGFQKRLKS